MDKLLLLSFAAMVLSLVLQSTKDTSAVEVRSDQQSAVVSDLDQEKIWPADGIVTSSYGPRWGQFHYGLDIAAAPNTPIRAVAPGRVYFAGNAKGYGKTVIIEHDDGSKSLYGHLKRHRVRWGAWIEAGTIIGKMGASGHATGYHLHFEWRDADGKALNPIELLMPPPESFYMLKNHKQFERLVTSSTI